MHAQKVVKRFFFFVCVYTFGTIKPKPKKKKKQNKVSAATGLKTRKKKKNRKKNNSKNHFLFRLIFYQVRIFISTPTRYIHLWKIIY